MADGHATFLLFTQASVMIMAYSKMLIFGFFRMSVRHVDHSVYDRNVNFGFWPNPKKTKMKIPILAKSNQNKNTNHNMDIFLQN